MSVVGIDFGDESSYVAVARAGGIETVDNDYSLRATPSFVAFGGKQRVLGVAAKNQHITNVKNTIYGFKRCLGRKYNDAMLSPEETARFPFKTSPMKNGGIGINVNFLGEEQVYSAEQITAMLFSKLKETTETAMQASVHDCVISCPSFFTNSERQALLDAAAMAGFHVLRLFNDTTATALSYGIYKQDLPAEEEPPRHVIFVDCGHTALQVFACAFHKGKLKMLATTYDATLGGRDFTAVIATHFCEEFKKKYGIDPRTNHRAYIRLTAEVEKLKKQMSANSTKLPFGIECLMDEKDVSSSMTRTDYEAMAAPLFNRVETCLKSCLVASGLQQDAIYAVEIIGGASRTPAIKGLIEKVFAKTASTTLNQDEAVARGCALMCAILSPVFKVREFSVTDVQQYPIKIIYDEASNEKGEMEVFPQFHPVPFSKMLTFYRRDAFTLRAAYNSNAPFLNPAIGSYTITDVKAPAEENIKIKVKANVNLHGIFNITSASAYEKIETEAEPMESNGNNGVAGTDAQPPESQPNAEQDQNAAGGQDGTQPPENANQAQNSTPDAAKEEPAPKPKKPLIKTIDLPITRQVHGFTRTELDHLIETEVKLVSQDRVEKERIDAKNALEEYIYDLRDKLEGDLRDYIGESERIHAVDNLTMQEEWLYDDGSEEKKSTFIQRLDDLKKLGEPVKSRRRELDEFPNTAENFSIVLTRARKIMSAAANNDPAYDHLDDAEVKKLATEIDATSTWFDQACGKVRNARKDLPLPVRLTEFIQKIDAFTSTIAPIVNKSKPKVEPPKEEPMEASPKNPKPAKTSDGKGTPKNESATNEVQDNMEVD